MQALECGNTLTCVVVVLLYSSSTTVGHFQNYLHETIFQCKPQAYVLFE